MPLGLPGKLAPQNAGSEREVLPSCPGFSCVPLRNVSSSENEHGTVPLDDLYEELRATSCNNGNVDMDKLLAGQPQMTADDHDSGFQLFRVGDAVSSRDIHCAILDSRRLCKDL